MSTERPNGIKIPDHNLPSDYSDVHPQSYDPDYISQISSQMQVPDRIGVSRNFSDHPGMPSDGTSKGVTMNGMTVPDRILVAGDNQHIGMKSDLALHLHPEQPGDNQEALSYVGLLTPPRTLTMEERFPMVEEDKKVEGGSESTTTVPIHHHSPQPPANGRHVVPPPPYDPGVNPHDSMLLNEEDEVTLLRAQMSKLARRVHVIEEEHNKRAQREFVLYPVIFGYLLWKVLGWMARDGRG